MRLALRFREENPEVLYAADPFVMSGPADVALLKRRAAENPRRRCRICSHRDPSAPVHEMLIAHHRSVYVRPHLHLGKSESLLVVEGDVTAVMFDEHGRVSRAIDMGMPGSGRTFYYHMPERVAHSLIIRSEWLVFVETTVGPFDRTQTVFPDWAPADADTEKVAAFTRRVAAEAEAVLATSP